MIQTIDLRGLEPSRREMLALIPRSAEKSASVHDTVAELIADVRKRGESALREQGEKFDRVAPHELRVSVEAIAQAVEELDPAVRAGLEEAIARVRSSSLAQVPPSRSVELGEGAVVEQRWQAVDRVGLYVPGGKAVYPSSVVMNVVPAQVAGVRSIAIASPAQAEFGGRVHPTILGAAGLLGITEVYTMGGAGAVGALAYGVESLDLEPVSVITGPGNVFVAAAKRAVRGVVGIDSEAGPTEILIIADAAANPRLVAVDLISQAEHDELASAVLVTDSADLAEAVRGELTLLVERTKHRDRVVVSLAGAQSAIVLVDRMQIAAEFSNAYGPEHLELHGPQAEGALALITNAGAIFYGENSPVSLGDYLAGSNHVLPTGGGARFSSGLGAYTFLRPQQIIRYTKAGLSAVSSHIRSLSDSENLPAHGDAVDARFTIVN